MEMRRPIARSDAEPVGNPVRALPDDAPFRGH